MKTAIILIIIATSVAFSFKTDFLAEQKKYERVRTSINDKESVIIKKLEENGLKLDNLNILIVAFKEEEQLLIYAKNKNATTYKKILTYEICARSGELGPKRKQGDNQVPEGFYQIDRFNPTSNFYLSLGLNYPITADKRKSKADNLGGDIFIHGSCVTIGCLPMTDDKIKEIYLYAIHSRNNGQVKIPVYIFPFVMTDQNVSKYKNNYKNDVELINFWTNLKQGYDKFESDKKELKFSFDTNGNYTF